MKIILSVIAVSLVMITVSFYIPKVEAGFNTHSHNYADRGHDHNYAHQSHSHDRGRTDYADRNHTHRNFGSNYADANHNHDRYGNYAKEYHDHQLDRSSIKRIIESCSISDNNNIDCGY